MTDNFYRREIDLIQTLMRCCLWYAFAVLSSYFLYQSGRGEFHPFPLLLLFPEALVVWVICAFVRKRKLCVACILACAALMAALLPVPWYVPVGEACLRLYAFYRQKENGRKFARFWESWIPGTVLYLLFLLFHQISAQKTRVRVQISPAYASRLLLFFFGLFLVLYVLYAYMKNFHNYFAGRGGRIGREMFLRARRSNYAMLLILLPAGAAVVFLFTFLPLGIYRAVWNGIKWLFARILGIAYSSAGQLGTGGNGNGAGSGMGAGTLETAPPVKASPASGIGGQILGTLLILGILFAVIWFLIKFFKGVLANYQAGTDTAEFVSVRSGEEKRYPEEKSGGIFHKKFGNSNREKVRKYYYQTMTKRFAQLPPARRANVKTGQTPEEMRRLFTTNEADGRRLAELTAYYEKARYGENECSAEEAEAARKLSL